MCSTARSSVFAFRPISGKGEIEDVSARYAKSKLTCRCRGASTAALPLFRPPERRRYAASDARSSRRPMALSATLRHSAVGARGRKAVIPEPDEKSALFLARARLPASASGLRVA
jgi:hypothetical protein